jgi:putative hydrolase of the HAD superfamily
MLPFDAILFDVGGVLLTNGWDHRERASVIAQFGLDLAAFETRHAGQNDAWERDAISLDAYLDATVFYEPRRFSKADFFVAMCAQSLPLENGALGILAELAASGKYRMGVLNNEARATNDYRFERYGIRQQIGVAFSSCYLGLRKPHAEIYRRVLDILGGPAERKLFIDDRAENAAGAVAAGMKAIRFEGADQLRGQLAALGVF